MAIGSIAKKSPAPLKSDKPAIVKVRGRRPGGIKAPRPLRAIGGYFKGAWQELREVRWPNRQATMSLTAAVLLFSLFFVVLIVTLDTVLNYLFKEILL